MVPSGEAGRWVRLGAASVRELHLPFSHAPQVTVALIPTAHLFPHAMLRTHVARLGAVAFQTARACGPVSRRTHSKLTMTSESEMAHFNALADTWWAVDGPQRILHKMNLLRMDFVNEMIKSHLLLNRDAQTVEEEVYIPCYNLDLLPPPVKNAVLAEQATRRDAMVRELSLTVLDVGCGGGLFAESMGRMPWVQSVVGIDLSEQVLAVAQAHRVLDPVVAAKVSYSLLPVEDLPETATFDVVSMFEMLEHVDYPAEVLAQALKRVKVGGWVFLSTINRDFVSWFTTIFMGEHVLGIVPVGTHTYAKYINESEVKTWMEGDFKKDGRTYKVMGSRGCVYVPLYGWTFTESAGVGNYLMAVQRVS